MEPQSNFYVSPIVVLDFQSLYPSIMIAYNYCYSTCLGRYVNSIHEKLGFLPYKASKETLSNIKENFHVSPNGVAFVKSSVRQGILPKMLKELLETRVMVKNAMKRYKNSKLLYKILDARQLSLKLLSNVIYGYTSAMFSGRMPCPDIADSIVQSGRTALENAINFINNHPTWNATVVYGDTGKILLLFSCSRFCFCPFKWCFERKSI